MAEIVPRLDGRPAAAVLSWVVTCVSAVAGDSRQSCAVDYYGRDNGAYVRWDAVGRDKDAVLAWMDRNVHSGARRQA
jgi:glutaconate CoA-transferase, subunit A